MEFAPIGKDRYVSHGVSDAERMLSIGFSTINVFIKIDSNFDANQYIGYASMKYPNMRDVHSFAVYTSVYNYIRSRI